MRVPGEMTWTGRSSCDGGSAVLPDGLTAASAAAGPPAGSLRCRSSAASSCVKRSGPADAACSLLPAGSAAAAAAGCAASVRAGAGAGMTFSTAAASEGLIRVSGATLRSMSAKSEASWRNQNLMYLSCPLPELEAPAAASFRSTRSTAGTGRSAEPGGSRRCCTCGGGGGGGGGEG